MKLFEDLPSTNTPITAENLNQIKDKLLVVSSTEPTGDDREKVWIQKGKNLYNKDNIIVGMSISSSDGTLSSSSTHYFCGYIPVIPNTIYSRSDVGTYGVVFLDKNTNYLSSYTGTNMEITFTTPADCYYIGFNMTVSKYTDLSYKTFMINQGTTLLPFEKYIEPKVYLKNNNEVYEEFNNKIEVGKMLYNSNISNVDINEWVKHEKIVSVSFRGKVGTDIGNDSILLTLPFKPAIQGTPILYSGTQYGTTNELFSYFVSSNSYLKSSSITSGQYIHVYFMYITNE